MYAGHIKMPNGPHKASGPDVVQVSSKVYYFVFQDDINVQSLASDHLREVGQDVSDGGLGVGVADRGPEGHAEKIFQHLEASQGPHQSSLPCHTDAGKNLLF